MAWIELHQSLWTHKKTIMLAALLEIDEIYAAAHMSKLWTWALDNAQDGDLSNLPSRVIAFGAGWKGEADKFIDSLKESGWIDEDGMIHDWFDYAGRLIEKKNANKERMKKARAKNVQRTDDTHTTHVQGLPNLTLPNQINTTTATAREEEKPEPPKPEKPAPVSYICETVNEAHTKVFGTTFIQSMYGTLYAELLNKGRTSEYVIELILEAGESTPKPSVRYIREIDERWQREGIASREDSRKRRGEVRTLRIVDRPSVTGPPPPKEYVPPDDDITRLMREAYKANGLSEPD